MSVVPMVLLKVAAHWLLPCFNRAARKLRSYGFLHRIQPRHSSSHCLPPLPSSCLDLTTPQTLVCDFGTLLRPTPSLFFPYFMLVAFEGGSLIRALLLLLSSPVLWAFGYQSGVSFKIMVFLTFCGLRPKDMDLVSRAVLPKFYLERLHLQACQVVMGCGGRRAVFCGLIPRVMVEGFVREHLGVSEVFGPELGVVGGGAGGFFSGLVYWAGLELKQKGLKDLFGESKAGVGLVSPYITHDHLFISHCKEAYIVTKESKTSIMPREKYPKPLVFHDSRLAFLPTPISTLSLFLFLPLSVPLSIARIALGVLPPYKLLFLLGALTGVRFRVRHHGHLTQTTSTTTTNTTKNGGKKGVIYVCTHRTLLDPVMLATALQRPVPAVTYSLSPLSEAIAPMRTVRLTRNRQSDSDTILRLLKEGDLTICPEGTTCREPYLLRFSPLFAELADEIVPVAMDANGSWFYGTTASGLKGLDPLFFFMNPRPAYRVEFLDRVPGEMTCGGGGGGGVRSGSDVANRVQKQLGDALGFECTGLTRRDKYMMLAGNEGVVRKKESKE